jgi:hypothetical protein
MANYSSTNRPAYVWDATNSVWVPIGTGPHTHSVADVSNAVTLGGGSVIQPGNANVKGLAIAGAASQTANLQEWQTSGFTPVAYVDPNGNFVSTGSASFTNLYAAGKNKIVNGNFDYWSRGTSFTVSSYTADHWLSQYQPTTVTSVARSTDVPNYQSKYSALVTFSNHTGQDYFLRTPIERPTYMSNTITVSFWAKTASGTMPLVLDVNDTGSGTFTINSTWTKYSYTYTGSNGWMDTVYPSNIYAFLDFSLYGPGPYTGQLYIAQVQLENGSVATPFTLAGGDLGGELKSCQRYYWRTSAPRLVPIMVYTTNSTYGLIRFPTTMRTAPVLGTSGVASHFTAFIAGSAYIATAVPAIDNTATPDTFHFGMSISGGTAGQAGVMGVTNAAGYLEFSAELI